jgi:(E)-4-hydroxy-3-methylbut-2-enyl-diphosphate synthase
LHLGVTEAGGLRHGSVKSAIGIGNLLWAGIGDTIRVSLSADPVEEIKVGFDILKSLGIRSRGVNIVACPSCARQGFNVIETVRTLEERLAHIPEPITLSIIGCVVNGPGEAAYTELGFTGGGAGSGMMYVNGRPSEKVSNAEMIERIIEKVEQRAEQMRAVKSAAE